MIEVFQAEKDAGLEEIIKANASIAYATLLESLTAHDKERIAKASLNDLLKLGINNTIDKDLYYNKSILVSTGWNLNDDIFHPLEVWNARKSPQDKPSNLDHNEKLICGHMTGVWAINELGDIIPDDTEADKLPDFFHLFTNNVIYTHWEDLEFKDRIVKCIEKIEKKEKFVSMECLFANFDYGLIDTNGVNKIVARQRETAHLTKYLKSYGGPGIYKGMKIGRLLRSIAFSGKGYVDRPANPQSIIFSESEFISFAKAELVDVDNLDNGVLEVTLNNNTENDKMEELEQLKQELEQVKAAKADLEAKLTTFAQVNEKITELSNLNTSLAAELESLQAKWFDKEKKDKEDEEEKKKTKSELEAALAKIAEYEAKAAEFEKDQKKNKRKAQLTEVGVSNEEADATVTKFENLDDEQFSFVVELASRANKSAASKAEQILEEVEEVEEVELSASSENEEVTKAEKTRAELATLLTTAMSAKKNKKK